MIYQPHIGHVAKFKNLLMEIVGATIRVCCGAR